MKIWAHTLVKNEGRYLWFVVMSVVDYVDKVLIWDTGSADATKEIIKELQKARPSKIKFRDYGSVDINQFTKARQDMLLETPSDWIMILDGDEVWWEEKIKESVEFIQKNGHDYDSIVQKYINIIGDIYHIQDERASRYEIDNKLGSYTIRFINRGVKGLSAQKPHGQFGYFDKNGVSIQDLPSIRRHHIDGPSYLHFTHLTRSTKKSLEKNVPKRPMKHKYELGQELSYDFYYPEVFFKPKSDVVPSPWFTRDKIYLLKASLETPLKNIKRGLPTKKSGY